MTDYSPEFRAAFLEHKELLKRGLEDTPEGRAALARLLSVAPESFKQSLFDLIQQHGLVPPASGYLPDGTPVYTPEDIARHMGITVEEAKARLVVVSAFGFAEYVDRSSVASTQ
jgi:hypothetical protein